MILPDPSIFLTCFMPRKPRFVSGVKRHVSETIKLNSGKPRLVAGELHKKLTPIDGYPPVFCRFFLADRVFHQCGMKYLFYLQGCPVRCNGRGASLCRRGRFKLALLVFVHQLFELFAENPSVIAAHLGAADKTRFRTLDTDHAMYSR